MKEGIRSLAKGIRKLGKIFQPFDGHSNDPTRRLFSFSIACEVLTGTIGNLQPSHCVFVSESTFPLSDDLTRELWLPEPLADRADPMLSISEAYLAQPMFAEPTAVA